MDYSSLVMVGAALDDKGLEKAKKWLDDIKRWKLKIRAEKHRGNTYTFPSLMYHLNEELREFRQAVRKQKDATSVMIELADVSNMVDMIVSTIMANEDKN